MSKRGTEEINNSYEKGTNPIDAVACLAAVSWFGAAIVLSWWRTSVPLIISLERAFIGAIGVYVTVFVGLYVMIWMANRTAHRKRVKKTQEKNPD